MKIVFDQRIKTHDDWVCGVDVLPSEEQSIEYAISIKDSVMMREVGLKSEHAMNSIESLWHKGSLTRKGFSRGINECDKALGHSSEAITCATVCAEGILLKENFNPCEYCALGKERQTNVSKKAVPRSKQFTFNQKYEW